MSGGAEPILSGVRVRLRRVTGEDVAALADILAQPGVAEWWHGYDVERVRHEFVEYTDDCVPFVVELDGCVIGFVQYGEENEPDYRHANIDIALHPDRHGMGLGADTLHTLARHLFEERGHHRITIDPAVRNTRAVRSYERVGFKRVGVMREYERAADGTWRDGLLMDLLPSDLRPLTGA